VSFDCLYLCVFDSQCMHVCLGTIEHLRKRLEASSNELRGVKKITKIQMEKLRQDADMYAERMGQYYSMYEEQSISASENRRMVSVLKMQINALRDKFSVVEAERDELAMKFKLLDDETKGWYDKEERRAKDFAMKLVTFQAEVQKCGVGCRYAC
jgi:hypothetical protein